MHAHAELLGSRLPRRNGRFRRAPIAVAAASILLAELGSAAGLSGAQAAPLYPQPFFEVGDLAVGLAAADLNDDGLADLVVGARRVSGGCAEVLLAGSGSLLRSAGCVPVGGDPVAFASADFDRDGHADIAIGWNASAIFGGGGVVIDLGNGDGTFREAWRIPAGRVGDLASGDFDGDGLPDLVVVGLEAASNAPYASIVRGSGDGTFGAPMWEKRSGQPVRVATADFDGDGLTDLALTDLVDEDVEVYLGSPSGALALRSAYFSGMSPVQVAAADLDGDGHTDLAVVNRQDSEIRALGGLGNGKFQPWPGLALGESPGELAAGDFDGDGRADLAVGQESAHGIVLLRYDGIDGLRRVGIADARPDRLVAVDLDGDGLADLAAASGTGVAVLRSLDDFAFAGNVTLSEGTVLRGTCAHDFDLDGRDDLAVFYPYNGDIYVYPGRSDGTFGAPVELESGNPPEILRAGDFNGDGVPDLASVGYGQAVFFFGLGGGEFGPASPVLLPDPVTADVAVADMNRDGLDDLVIVARPSLYLPPGFTTFVLPERDGTFSVSQRWDAGSNPQGVAVADFDEDGDPDLVVTNIEQVGLYYTGSLSLYMNLGDLVLAPAVSTPIDGTVHGVAAADLNGDDLPDLVVAETPAGQSRGVLEVFLGAGGGGFVSGGQHDATRNPVPVLVRDFDADGALDLATVGSAGGDVALLRGDGLGGFAPQEDYATHVSFQSLAAGDFNGDGLVDLALANQNTTLSDGKVIVVPARPPFPCLPGSGGEAGQCAQDAADVGISLQSPLGRGAALITWRTTHEYDLIGFNLVEFDHLGHAIRLNAAPIPCVECSTGLGAGYASPVAKHRSDREVFVEVLRRSGSPRLFGPAVRQ